MAEHLTPEQRTTLVAHIWGRRVSADADRLADMLAPVVADLVDQARAAERERILSTLRARAERMRCAGGGIYTRDYVQGFEWAHRVASEVADS